MVHLDILQTHILANDSLEQLNIQIVADLQAAAAMHSDV